MTIGELIETTAQDIELLRKRRMSLLPQIQKLERRLDHTRDFDLTQNSLLVSKYEYLISLYRAIRTHVLEEQPELLQVNTGLLDDNVIDELVMLGPNVGDYITTDTCGVELDYHVSGLPAFVREVIGLVQLEHNSSASYAFDYIIHGRQFNDSMNALMPEIEIYAGETLLFDRIVDLEQEQRLQRTQELHGYQAQLHKSETELVQTQTRYDELKSMYSDVVDRLVRGRWLSLDALNIDFFKIMDSLTVTLFNGLHKGSVTNQSPEYKEFIACYV